MESIIQTSKECFLCGRNGISDSLESHLCLEVPTGSILKNMVLRYGCVGTAATGMEYIPYIETG